LIRLSTYQIICRSLPKPFDILIARRGSEVGKMAADDTDLPSDQDRATIQRTIRALLDRDWPAAAYDGNSADPSVLRTLWLAMCGQGFSGLGRDPAEGGLRELILTVQELGRSACLAPVLVTFLANRFLPSQAEQDEELAVLLESVRAGTAVLALCFDGEGGNQLTIDDHCVPEVIGGVARLVEGAQIATHFLVLSRSRGALAIIAKSGGVRVEPTRAMGDAGLCQVHFADASAKLIAIDEADATRMIRISQLCFAARAQASAAKILDMAVEYAKERRQFGKAIGSFQAIQHKLVNNLVAVEACGAILEEAAAAFDFADPDWEFLALSSFALAAASIRQVALENHHVFGAIGYSEEHEAPRHFKRIHVDMLRFGGAKTAREELASRFLDQSRHFPEIQLNAAGSAFRNEVRDWLKQHWTDEDRRLQKTRPFKFRDWDRRFAEAVGDRGWIAMNWPENLGGQPRRPIEILAFQEAIEEVDAPRFGAPIQAPMLIHHGNPEQQDRYLAEIGHGSVLHGMAYSEPNSGSDLASLQTTAQREGDEYIINGQKIWCTSYHGQYLLVAVRTDRAARPPHAGISLFIREAIDDLLAKYSVKMPKAARAKR
jgi:alkylation response protein AidB-like acyl-CoA dehydrogenase